MEIHSTTIYGKTQVYVKHCENRKTLPREHLIGCQGVKLFLLKDNIFFLYKLRFAIF